MMGEKIEDDDEDEALKNDRRFTQMKQRALSSYQAKRSTAARKKTIAIVESILP